MSLTTTVDGADTTVKFEYTAATTKVTNTLTDAANELFNRGQGDHGTEEAPIVWADLNNAQKAALLDDHIKQVMLDLAEAFHVNASKEAAQATAESELTTKYI